MASFETPPDCYLRQPCLEAPTVDRGMGEAWAGEEGSEDGGSSRAPDDEVPLAEAEEEQEEELADEQALLEQALLELPAATEALRLPPPVSPPQPGKPVHAHSVELLPSIFDQRPPTIFFDSPVGLPPRGSTAPPASASKDGALPPTERIHVPLDAAPRSLCMRMEKNANSVRHAFKRAGFTVNPTSESARPLVCWARHSGDKLWKELPLGSIVNHFPGSWTLGRKDGLAKILTEQQRRLGGHEYNFIPRTFTLPADRASLERAIAEGSLQGDGAFIVKPLNSSRGRGIHLCSDLDELELDAKVLVQEYIAKPLLLQERKFDLRIYVLVTSFEPLRAYTFEQGLARFATQPYSPPSAYDVGDRSAHLTNYSINKHDDAYVANVNAEDDATGHKWSLAAVYRALAEKGVDVVALRRRIDSLLAKTLIAAQPHVCSKYAQHFSRRGACFELFGFDVMLDAHMHPWLIEVNVSPDLASTSPLDRQLKGTLATDVLHLVGVRPPADICAAAGVVSPPPPRPDDPPMFARQYYNGRHHSELANVPFANLSASELQLLVENEEEWTRAKGTGFRRIYPPTGDAQQLRLSKLFEVMRYADQLTLAYIRRQGRINELRDALAAREGAPVSRPPPPTGTAAFAGAAFPPAATAAIRDAAIAAATAAAAATRAGAGTAGRPATTPAKLMLPRHLPNSQQGPRLASVRQPGQPHSKSPYKLPRKSSSSRSASRGKQRRQASPVGLGNCAEKPRPASARTAEMAAALAARSASTSMLPGNAAAPVGSILNSAHGMRTLLPAGHAVRKVVRSSPAGVRSPAATRPMHAAIGAHVRTTPPRANAVATGAPLVSLPGAPSWGAGRVKRASNLG